MSIQRRAFTIVELLVAIAIISILAAIATQNFLEAQVRSKVARTKSDLRTIRIALEVYATDQGAYPLNAGGIGLTGALYNLLAPVRYLSALPLDVFRDRVSYYYYASGQIVPEGPNGSFVLAGSGPDRTIETTTTATVVYDPTNGTVSSGDIVLTHKSAVDAENVR